MVVVAPGAPGVLARCCAWAWRPSRPAQRTTSAAPQIPTFRMFILLVSRLVAIGTGGSDIGFSALARARAAPQQQPEVGRDPGEGHAAAP